MTARAKVRRKVTVRCQRCGLPVWRLQQANGAWSLVDTVPDDEGTVRVIRRQIDGFGSTAMMCEELTSQEAAQARRQGEKLHTLHFRTCEAFPHGAPNPMPKAIREVLVSRGHLSEKSGAKS